MVPWLLTHRQLASKRPDPWLSTTKKSQVLLERAIMPSGKALHLHCLVPQKGLNNSWFPAWLLTHRQLASKRPDPWLSTNQEVSSSAWCSNCALRQGTSSHCLVPQKGLNNSWFPAWLITHRQLASKRPDPWLSTKKFWVLLDAAIVPSGKAFHLIV